MIDTLPIRVMQKFRNSEDWRWAYPGETKPKAKTFWKKSDDAVESVSGNAHFLNCGFQGLSGRAITCSSTDAKLLIEECFFSSCRSFPDNNHGGAVQVTKGACVMRFVCSFCCYTASECNGQFCYLCANVGANAANGADKNEIHDSSVLSSRVDDTNIYSPIFLHVGTQYIKGVNISNNTCHYHSAICVWGRQHDSHAGNANAGTTANTEVDVNIMFCTMSYNTNTASGTICICLGSNSNTPVEHVTECNIISNEHTKDHGLITSSSSKCKVENCCIKGNTPADANTFYEGTGSTIEVVNCTIDYSTAIGSVTMSKATPDKNFIHAFTFYEASGLCVSDYDSFDDLTPDIPTQTPAPSKSKFIIVVTDYSNSFFDTQMAIKCILIIIFMTSDSLDISEYFNHA